MPRTILTAVARDHSVPLHVCIDEVELCRPLFPEWTRISKTKSIG